MQAFASASALEWSPKVFASSELYPVEQIIYVYFSALACVCVCARSRARVCIITKIYTNT